MANLFNPSSVNATQKTLGAALLTGATASVTLNSVTSIVDGLGAFVVDRVDSNGVSTASKREYITFTGVSGSTLTGLTRSADGGGSDQDHAVGAIVEFVNDVVQAKAVKDVIETEHTTAGVHATAVFSNSLYYQALINAGFTVNQRGYVSNATLASGAYGHDRWKAGAGGGDYTFTQLAQATTITIKAGKTLIQVIEDKNVIGGTYTLSWTGTAQARYAVDSATPGGAYAASPIAITGQTAGTVMSVEFNEGTLGKVQLNSGSVALPFMAKRFEDELRACQRYCYAATGSGLFGIGVGSAHTTTEAAIAIYLPVEMKAIPTLTATGTEFVLMDGQNAAVHMTDILSSTAATSKKFAWVTCTTASGLTAFRPYFLTGDNGGTRLLLLTAEL